LLGLSCAYIRTLPLDCQRDNSALSENNACHVKLLDVW
jgi:hypothetical protein